MPPSPLDDQDFDQAAEVFKALVHPDRLRLACVLGDGRVTTQRDLLEEFDWPQSSMARHVAVLRRAGLVEAERHGSEVHLRLAGEVGSELMTTVCDWIGARAGV